jgi:phage gp29-like protein
LDTNDKISFHEAAHPNGHLTFWDRMRDSDNRIAKLINGQTGTSENGAWAGTANVHERVQSDYTLARLRRLQKHVNETLIPKLVSMGMPLSGAELVFLGLEAKPEVLVSESENNSGDEKKN